MIFEYYRNHSATEASERIANDKLELCCLIDVFLAMSNQWVLEYEKIHATSKVVCIL